MSPLIRTILVIGTLVATMPGDTFATDDINELYQVAPGTVFRDCTECPEMVVIPPGSFMMGTTKVRLDTPTILKLIHDANKYQDGGYSIRKSLHEPKSEMPRHLVNIHSKYAIGRFPITRQQYAKFVQESGYEPTGQCVVIFTDPSDPFGRGMRMDGSWRNPGFPQTDDDPVVCVSWTDAQEYAAWLSAKTRQSYDLPSEAEWEYAARGGTTTGRYWGDDLGNGHANCRDCGTPWDGKGTSPVGTFPPNPFGLFDMLGNVGERVGDCAASPHPPGNYDGAPIDGSTRETTPCEQHIVRGGSWTADAYSIRSAHRSSSFSSTRLNSTGFRVSRR